MNLPAMNLPQQPDILLPEERTQIYVHKPTKLLAEQLLMRKSERTWFFWSRVIFLGLQAIAAERSDLRKDAA